MSADGQQAIERRGPSPTALRVRANLYDAAPWLVWAVGIAPLYHWAFYVLTDFRQIGAPLACAFLLTYLARFASYRIRVGTQRMRMKAALDIVGALPPGAAHDHLPPEAVELVAHLHRLVDAVEKVTEQVAVRETWEWLREVSRLTPSTRARLETAGVDIDAIERSVTAALNGPPSELGAALQAAEHALITPSASGYR